MTVTCLEKLKIARARYNEFHDTNLIISVFLTDDKCTDGTSDAVRECMEGEDINIIEADGNAFWAGGMRIAWNAAKEKGKFDFYLLLNDDTEVWDNLFEELFDAHMFCVKSVGKGGVYSGNTTWKKDRSKMSFGGKKNKGFFIKRFVWVFPNGTPQRCDIVNANILMVASEVVDAIGIFADYYIHGAADNDYAMRANAAGFPVVVTGDYCGSCDADNYNHRLECDKLNKMSIAQRNKYFSNPVHSIHDKLEFSIRWRKMYVPVIFISHFLHKYFPLVYGRLMGNLH
jgi:GT2 family glycosyltransferase